MGVAGAGGTWQGDGCVVKSRNGTFTVCSCTHLTLFKVDLDAFEPTFNTLSAEDFLNLTWENIMAHPVPFIMLNTWLGAYLILLFLVRLHDQRLDRAAFMRLLKQWPLTVGRVDEPEFKDPTILANEKQARYGYYVLINVKEGFKTSHLWFSIPFRDVGDSFTSAGRLTFACVLVLTGFMISALFYGTSQTAEAEIVIAIITTGIMLPITMILQFTFQATNKERVKEFLFNYAKDMVYQAYRDGPSSDAYRVLMFQRPVTSYLKQKYVLAIALIAQWVKTESPHAKKLSVVDEFQLRCNLRSIVAFDLDHLFWSYNQRTWREKIASGWLMLSYIFLTLWVATCAMLMLVRLLFPVVYLSNITPPVLFQFLLFIFHFFFCRFL